MSTPTLPTIVSGQPRRDADPAARRGPLARSHAEQFTEHLTLWEGDGTGQPETVWLAPAADERYNGHHTNER